jgi:hypothetical protein
LLWFAVNPADPRRRPIVAAYLSELIADVANNVTICDTDFPRRQGIVFALRETEQLGDCDLWSQGRWLLVF